LKLLTVCFDSVGWKSVILDPPPYFASLMEDHPCGRLFSTRIPHTIPAAFAVYEGIDRSEDWSKGFNWNTSWYNAKRPMIFDFLAKKGVTMGLVSLPLSAPVRPYKNFVLGTWMKDRKTEKLGEKTIFYPPQVEEIVGEHKGCILRELGVEQYAELVNKPFKGLRESKKLARHRLDNFLTLNKWKPVDFGFLYFDFTDRMGHVIRPDSKVLPLVMKLSDELLSRVVKETNPQHVLVYSDHGWGFFETEYHFHAPTGFYIYTGREGARHKARIVDIAPTILKEFGVGIPNYFEGRVL